MLTDLRLEKLIILLAFQLFQILLSYSMCFVACQCNPEVCGNILGRSFSRIGNTS